MGQGFRQLWHVPGLVFALHLLALPCEAQANDFPQVDPSKLLITLERTACLGACPDYTVTIGGGGDVVFTSSDDGSRGEYGIFNGVLWRGRHEDRVSPDAVDKLVARFRDAGFFGLRDRYVADWTDLPTYRVTIDTGHGRKRVIDYLGTEAGMPQSVRQLEDEIDRLAGTARWVRGAEGLVDWLAEHGFDFHSDQAAMLAVQGAQLADESTLINLISRGAPLEGSHGYPVGGRNPATAGEMLLDSAISFGKPILFRRLAEDGWLRRRGLAVVNDKFADDGGGCNPDMVTEAFRAGIDVRHASVNGDNREGVVDVTALHTIATSYQCDDESQRVETARRLLGYGADPNLRNEEGETAIFSVENVELLDLLLGHGADATAKDRQGNSAIFSTWTDVIVIRLLAAGASPEGHYRDGRTLAEQAAKRNMPLTAQWLADHAGASHSPR